MALFQSQSPSHKHHKSIPNPPYLHGKKKKEEQQQQLPLLDLTTTMKRCCWVCPSPKAAMPPKIQPRAAAAVDSLPSHRAMPHCHHHKSPAIIKPATVVKPRRRCN
jgi:hypothetical protein